VSAPRERLAALAAAAGYEPDVLALIAQATFRAYRTGQRLTDPQVNQITIAVEVLAQAGARADTLPGIVAHYQRRYGPYWRDWFWSQQLRTANLRHQHPERYDHSPRGPYEPPGAAGRASPTSSVSPPPPTRHEAAAGGTRAATGSPRPPRPIRPQPEGTS